MTLSDLSTEDDDSDHCEMNRYNKKIDSLMNEVSCLKSEVRALWAGQLVPREQAGWVKQMNLWRSPVPRQLAFPGHLFGEVTGQLEFPPY